MPVIMPMVSEKAKEYEAKAKAEQATPEGEQGKAELPRQRYPILCGTN
jgi:hypothetical protein